MDGIGDFVLATTFLNCFAKAQPSAEVTVVCRAPTAELARWQYPQWDIEVVPAKVRPFREIIASVPVRRRMSALPEFDTLVDLRGYRDAADAAISTWIPAKQKFAITNGLSSEFRWAALPNEERAFDCLISRPERSDEICEDIACHRALVRELLGVDSSLLLPNLRVKHDEIASLREKTRISHESPLLVVCPGTSIPQKEYPPAALAHAIIQSRLPSDVRIVLAGGKNDARTILPLLSEIRKFRPVTDLSGQLTIAENAILLATADFVIAMDSCHAHIAGAVGTPALVLLSGRQRGFFGPWNPSPTFRWLFSSDPQTEESRPFIYDKGLSSESLPVSVVSDEISSLMKIALSRVNRLRPSG